VPPKPTPQLASTEVNCAALDQIPVEHVPAAILRLSARLVAAPKTGETMSPVCDDLLTVPEAAKLLQVSETYVFSHSRELGAIRLGSGPKARLRFKRSKLLARLGR